MGEKNKKISEYIVNISSRMNEQYNGIMNDEKIQRAIDMFSNSDLPYEEIIEQINKLASQVIKRYIEEKEKRFNPELVKENHKEIYDKLEILIKKLNERGVDYQLAGALCAYIKYGVESSRTHDDIDINLNESDMNKFREVCEEMGLQFHDNRMTTPRVLKNGIPAGDHEVLATLDGSDFHIGAFCFERKPDGTVINKGYYHDDSGQIYTRDEVISPELAEEIFGREEVNFRGQKLVITPPEFVYRLKNYTKKDKDLVDIMFMEGRIDKSKLERINELSKKSKIEHNKVNIFKQNFNYHTHTYRSGHSEYCSDEEILKASKQKGITKLGFSEHIPNPSLILPDENHRMLYSEVDDYISSINKMKNANPDMTILSGFEAEFDPMRESYLGEMREKVDYMILGQHFVPRGLMNVTGTNNPNYPIEYANIVSKAIDSGIFDIVAHPDIFMQFRDTMNSEENKNLFDENGVIASQIICEKARDMGIPLEINLNEAFNSQLHSKDSLKYPSKTFWKVASEIDGLQVLQGIDAHTLRCIKDVDKSAMKVSDITEMMRDKFVSKDYNPVVARQNNVKLQEAYKQGQDKALSFETHMVNQSVSNICNNLNDGMNSEDIAIGIGQGLNVAMQECIDNANAKDKSVVDDISQIAENDKMPLEEKKVRAERKKKVIDETNQVLSNQQLVIGNAKNSVISAVNIGCQNKEEFINMTTQITEHNSSVNERHKSTIENQVSTFQQSKGTSSINVNEKNPILVKKQNSTSHNQSSGFASTASIIMIVTFIVGFVAGITYMICKFMIGG
jgi:histidinol-phosphatase (PHP family)